MTVIDPGRLDQKRPFRLWLSTIAIVVGVSLMLVGMSLIVSKLAQKDFSSRKADPHHYLVAGTIVLLGTLSYRSAKRRRYKLIPLSEVRCVVEGLPILYALVWCVRGGKGMLFSEPITTWLIPCWTISAYMTMVSRIPLSFSFWKAFLGFFALFVVSGCVGLGTTELALQLELPAPYHTMPMGLTLIALDLGHRYWRDRSINCLKPSNGSHLFFIPAFGLRAPFGLTWFTPALVL